MSHPRTRTLARGIYKRGNSYYLDYKDENGKRIRRSGGTDLHRALDLLYKLRGPLQEKGRPTLKIVLDSYLERQQVYSKPKSVRNARSSSRRLIRCLGDVTVGGLTQDSVDRFVTERRAGGVKDKTINGDLVILRAALNYAVVTGLVEKVPTKVKLLRVPKRRIQKVLTPPELCRLLECASGRTYGILLVAVHTGFRTDEILHLQWRDVGWEDCSLRVTTKDGIWSSKNHQERTVFVSQELIRWLADHRRRATWSGDGDWVFLTRNRTPVSVYNACRAVRRVFEEAGLYRKGLPTIHLIRHSVACALLSGGTDLETVRDWLGHADIATTSVYLHTTDQRKREAARRLPPLI